MKSKNMKTQDENVFIYLMKLIISLILDDK